MITTVRQVERQCPAELELAAPAKPALPAGAEISGNAAGLGYVGDRFRREEMLDRRLEDAAASCRNSAAVSP